MNLGTTVIPLGIAFVALLALHCGSTYVGMITLLNLLGKFGATATVVTSFVAV